MQCNGAQLLAVGTSASLVGQLLNVNSKYFTLAFCSFRHPIFGRFSTGTKPCAFLLSIKKECSIKMLVFQWDRVAIWTLIFGISYILLQIYSYVHYINSYQPINNVSVDVTYFNLCVFIPLAFVFFFLLTFFNCHWESLFSYFYFIVHLKVA